MNNTKSLVDLTNERITSEWLEDDSIQLMSSGDTCDNCTND